MDASVVLWEQWHEQVKSLFGSMHGHQKKTLAMIVLGMVLAGNAVLQRIAETVCLQGLTSAKMTSMERRLARFVANPRIEVTPCWQQFQRQVLPFWKGQKVYLVLDCTPFEQTATIIYVGILVQTRLLPVAWSVQPQQETWTQRQWDIVSHLFEQVAAHLQECECTLIADRGLTGFPLVHMCQQRGWHYVLRLCKQQTMRRAWREQFRDWQRADSFISKPGQQWFGRALVWQESQIPCWVSACWQEGFQEGWILISDQKAGWRRGSRVRLAHAGGSDLSGHQKPRLLFGGECHHQPGAAQSLVVGLVPSGVVGCAPGSWVHSSWTSGSF